jgi:SNF2 family DNA or RNA helicase
MKKFEQGAKPFDEAMTEIRSNREELRKETDQSNEKILYEAKLAIEANNKAFDEKALAWNQEYNRLHNEKLAFLHELNAVRAELEDAEKKKTELLQLLAAKERLEKVEKDFLSLIENAPFKDAILDYQFEDIVFAYDVWKQQYNGVANFNDMGLGKTFETIVWLRAVINEFYTVNSRKPLILWLTKKALIKTTHREIKRWDPDMKAIAFTNGGDVEKRKIVLEYALQANAIIITNYEALNTNKQLMNTKWDFIICDEVHKLKGGANPSGPTAIWQNLKELVHGTREVGKFVTMQDLKDRNAPFLNFLTGSPVNNHPRDMWAYLHIFNPERFNNLGKFEREFCYAYEQGLIDFERLITVMQKQCIRRRKDEVKIQLPDKTHETRFVEHTDLQRKFYEKMRDEFFIELDSMDPTKTITATAIIAQLTRLRQINLYPASVHMKNEDGTETAIPCQESAKLDEALDIIEELHREGEQVVVFSAQFNEPLDRLADLLHDRGITSRILSGATSNNVDDIVEGFQQKEYDVILINMKSGGEGLNLHKNPNFWPGGSSNVIFLDLWYNPMTNVQAEDRVHRKGQVNPVMVHILQAEDSVDAFIAEILEKKQNMIAGIMEDEKLRPSDWKEKLRGLI